MTFEIKVILDEPGIGKIVLAGNWEYTEVYHDDGWIETDGWKWVKSHERKEKAGLRADRTGTEETPEVRPAPASSFLRRARVPRLQCGKGIFGI